MLRTSKMGDDSDNAGEGWDRETNRNVRLLIDSDRYLGPNFESKDMHLEIWSNGKRLESVEVIVHLSKFCNAIELREIREKIDKLIEVQETIEEQRQSRSE